MTAQKSSDNTPRIFWGDAPLSKKLYGRHLALDTVQHFFKADAQTRVVILQGLGGVGKTSLAVKIVKRLSRQFDYIVWQSLYNRPSLAGVLKMFIEFAAPNSPIPDSPAKQIECVLEILKAHRCLLVLDNMESILKSGDNEYSRSEHGYDNGFEDYELFLDKILHSEHQSTLLLTSREVLDKYNEPASQHIQVFPIDGLDFKDGRKIIIDSGNRPHDFWKGSDGSWKKLNDYYKGNPLALKLISDSLQEEFLGNVDLYVTSFIQNYDTLFFDIESALYVQFIRLTAQEKAVLFWLAIEREATTAAIIGANMTPIGHNRPSHDNDYEKILLTLFRRSMVEKTFAPLNIEHFQLQPVILEFVTKTLVKKVIDELMSDPLPTDIREYPMLSSFALLKAVQRSTMDSALEDKRHIQKKMILEPIVYALRNAYRHSQLRQRCENMIAFARNRYDAQHDLAYFVGNILNLFIVMEEIQSGVRAINRLAPHESSTFDCSCVPIRQVDFRDVYVQNVDFQHAYFSECTFSEYFSRIRTLVMSHPYGAETQQIIAAGTENNIIRLWDLNTMNAIGPELTGHTNFVSTLAFSPDNSMLVSGSDDQSIRIWIRRANNTYECDREREISEILFTDGSLQPLGRINALGFSPDGDFLIWGSSHGYIAVHSMRGSAPTRVLQTARTSGVRSIAISPNAHHPYLLAGYDNKSVLLWNYRNPWDNDGPEIIAAQDDHVEHLKYITTVAWSPKGKYVAWCEDDGSLFISLSTNRDADDIVTYKASDKILSCVFSSDESRLITGDAVGRLTEWEIYPQSHSHSSFSLRQCTPTVMYESETSPDASKTSQSSPIYTIILNSDDTQLVVGGGNYKLQLWVKRQQGRDDYEWLRRETIYGAMYSVWSLDVSHDSRSLISGHDDGKVRIWDIDERGQQLVLKSESRIHSSFVWSVAFSPDNLFFVSSGDDQTIRIWDEKMKSTKLICSDRHTNWQYSLAFSPLTEKRWSLASGSDDGEVYIWESSSIKKRLSNTQEEIFPDVHIHQNSIPELTRWISSLAFSPDGRFLAIGSDDNVVCLWEIRRQECTFVISSAMLDAKINRVWSLKFNHRGNLLAFGSDDGRLHVWDMINNHIVRVPAIAAHKMIRIFSLDFSPDDHEIVVGCSDGHIRIFSITNGTWSEFPSHHTVHIWSVRYSPNGKFIVTGAEDGKIVVQHRHALHPPIIWSTKGIYANMNISHAIGLENQHTALEQLGAISLQKQMNE